MVYTVKQVAAMSGVSVRTLHFYDETDVLKPAYVGANGYRFYEEAQLLILQQILFYRELGFELRQIKSIVGRADFEKVAALQSHRQVLETKLARTQSLLATIDKTLMHLTGATDMKSEELFAGFSVAAGKDRFDEPIQLGGHAVDCKVSAADTHGTMCIFEFTTGWPCHLHHDQDEWVYVVDGELDLVIGGKRCCARAGESVFIPRKVAHVWAPAGDKPCKVLNIYQPAGEIEKFVREVSSLPNLPTREDVIQKTYTDEQLSSLRRLFDAHGMELLAPPPGWPGGD
jgi:DNA-binding transcriptional MerR regulator/quercetin dioxygenase-like cupin family protein